MFKPYRLGSGLICITTACLLFVGLAANAQEPATANGITRITVNTPQWDGFISKDLSGIYGETFQAVFSPLGIEIDLTITPYELSIKRVQQFESDVAMGVSLNFDPGVLYPKWPQEVEKAIAVHAPSIAYSSEQDLLGKKLAWLRGYRFERYLPEGVEFEEVRTEILGMRMLERGRVDFFIDYQPTILKAAEKGNVDLSKLKLSNVKALAKPVFPIFRQDARGRKIMTIYDRRMAELYADGTLDRLFRKYGYDDYPAPKNN